jgi:scyllo-inositol 2-dehydrogenase (NADP+)
MTPPASNEINVGLIGFGLGGATFHAPFIARTPGLRLHAILTGNADRRGAAQAEYPEAMLVTDVDALFATGVDAVAISTPNATHFPLAKRALEAGKHVIVDKPFATTAAEARELQATATRVGKLAIPFQNRRWDGDYLTLRSLIDAGKLGDVYRFESRFDRWRPIRKPGWQRPDANETAENIVHDLATHLVDQALQMFGPVKSVHAELRRIHSSIISSDDMFISLVHKGGVHSHLSSTMSAGVQGPRFHVYGTKAAYVKHGVDVQEAQLRSGVRPGNFGYGDEIPDMWGTLGFGTGSERVPTLKADYSPFYAGVAAAIRGEAPPPVTAESVIEQLEVIDACFESSARGAVVPPGEAPTGTPAN